MADWASLSMIVSLVAEGVGVAKEIAELAQKVERGETITRAEIDAARTEVNEAINDWKKKTGNE